MDAFCMVDAALTRGGGAINGVGLSLACSCFL